MGEVFDALGVDYSYETEKVPYVIPERRANYKPDWIIHSTGVRLETKGWLKPADRQKLALVKTQHPSLDLRVFFQRSSDASRPLSKGSSTTMGDWLEAHGIPWAAEALPKDWIIAADTGDIKPALVAQGPPGDPGRPYEVIDNLVYISSSKRSLSNARAKAGIVTVTATAVSARRSRGSAKPRSSPRKRAAA